MHTLYVRCDATKEKRWLPRGSVLVISQHMCLNHCDKELADAMTPMTSAVYYIPLVTRLNGPGTQSLCKATSI